MLQYKIDRVNPSNSRAEQIPRRREETPGILPLRGAVCYARPSSIRRDSTNQMHLSKGATLAGPPPRQVGFLNEGNRMRRWLALSLFALGVSSSLVLAQIGTATL